MTVYVTEPVIRRSALEAIHEALDARWIAESIRWPEGYGSRDAGSDVDAMGAGAGLAEIGPLEEVLLRGPGAIASAARLASGGEPVTAGRSVATDLYEESGAAWVLGPDEVLLLGSRGATVQDRLVAEVASGDVSVIEMTGARTTLRLAGPTSPAILAELCMADTRPTTLAPATVLQASIAGVRAFICREDAAGFPGYTIMVARDESAYVWNAICRIGATHALTVVGPTAVAPRGQA